MTPLVRLHYISAKYPTAPQRGTIVLLHGFPQTSYQYRYVITPLAKAGYHVICPDTRGAGASSHPPSGYSKSELAGDLRILLYDHEKIQGKVHVVGQDIGGMLAHAFAARFPEHIATVSIGECPLPGTEPFEASKHSPLLYHFDFQTVPDLPELLISGRERIYLKHFYDRAAYNPQAISQHDIDVYAESYSQPGAMRCGFELYRTFEEDSQYNRKIVRTRGKNKVAVMALYGEFSFCAEYVKQMLEEVYVGPVEVGMVRNASHWTTEENPDEFVDKVLGFIGKHKTNSCSQEVGF
ncbi:soluble epoxide hydrolase [Peziza echinospora]|nr:soluble epoxide hydrolase [Peziza echinospora]